MNGVEIRRRTPADVVAYVEAHAADIAALLPDPGQQADFKRTIVQAAAEFAGRERIGGQWVWTSNE